MNLRFPKIIVGAWTLAGFCVANAAPKPPSNLRVKVFGENSFQLKWKDNSKDELGWVVLAALKGGTPQRYKLIPKDPNFPDATTDIVITNPLAGKTISFQIASYNGAAGKESFSKPSSSVSVKALPGKFGAPTQLKAKAIDDSKIQLSWKDNSTSEHAYALEYKLSADKKWLTFVFPPGVKFKQTTSGFEPATDYSFRVRASTGSPVKFTKYSKVVKVTTQPFQPPSELVVTPEAEGAFSFKWKDNSSIEKGFELQRKVGNGDFVYYGVVDEVNANFASTISGFALDTDHQFRIRSYRDVKIKRPKPNSVPPVEEEVIERKFSEFSNVALVKSTGLKAPTNLFTTTISDASVTLTWKDESTRETRYLVEYRAVGAATFLTAQVSSAPGVITSAALTRTLSNLQPDTAYEFRVRALEATIFGQIITRSADTAFVQVRTKDAIIGDFQQAVIGTVGNQFTYQIQVTRPIELTDITVTGLPAGLTYNAGLRTITGAPTSAGSSIVTLRATFNDGTISTKTLNIRNFIALSAITPPIIAQSFAADNVAIGASKIISATGKFSDPDTQSAARIVTSKGTFDMIFFPLVTPLSVANFLNYVDDLRYNDTFFHRALTGFVVQGGGYKHTIADGFRRVVTFPTVNNEPGISNVRGTVAMAKLSTNPNSATSQFFFNLGNNSANLDVQNGGFTVFSRVPAAGMVIVDQIAALPTSTYSITTDFGTESLQNFPIDAVTAPAVLNPAQLVKITSVGPAPLLTYQVASANPAIATATVNGSNITIIGIAAGSTTIQVTATDLDGLTVAQTIAVTVP